MEQKLIRVKSSCTTLLLEAVNNKLSEMNNKGFRLVNMTTIPPTHGEYATNEEKEILFEKK